MKYEFPRVALGFQELFNELNRLNSPQQFPPFNLQQLTDDSYSLSLACAGYSKSELTVKLDDQVLIIEGQPEKRASTEELEYLYKGIAHRAFTKRIPLAKHFEVKNVKYKNGLLEILVERIVPENEKPKEFEIK